MKKHIILAGTTLAAVALCWAICGGTPTVDTVPASAAESAVSAPCAPQTQLSEPSSNNIITEPVTQPETVPVTGSAASPEQDCSKETTVVISEPQPTEETNEEPTVVPEPTPEEPTAELPATIPATAPTEEPIAESAAEEEPPAQNGMVYVPGFGNLKSEGPGEWSVSEGMYENGNKIGSMG